MQPISTLWKHECVGTLRKGALATIGLKWNLSIFLELFFWTYHCMWQKFCQVLENAEILLLYRRGHQGRSTKKAALKKLAIIRKKPPVLGSLFNNFAVLKAYKFIKWRIQHRCFPVEIVKFLKNTYFEEHLRTAVFILY